MPDSASAAYECFARYYDLMLGDRQPYCNFYCSLLGPDQASLLDIGCGTGTITAAVASAMRHMRRGQKLRAVGIDGSRAMLEIAAARDPDIGWVEGDLRLLPLKGPFDLAISCYNTLQHVSRRGLRQAFSAIRSVLGTAGRLAFDIYRPNLAYIRIPQRNRLARALVHPDGRRLEIREHTDFDEVLGVLKITWALVEPDSPHRLPLMQTRMQMWQHEPEDVQQALAETGFSVVEIFGGLDRSPYLPTSKKQVIVCRAI